MRLVHLSDLHLGYRQYQRLTPTGVNQREADVATTFRVVVDRIIELRPELVVVAGDVFHNVRPSNQAIVHAFLQFSRLVTALPESAIVLVAGNHDTPRTSETGGILQLFAQLNGIDVVDRQPRRLSFPHLDLSVLAVPDVPGLVKPSFTIDSDARYNVLAMHCGIEGLADNVAWDRPPVEVSPSELNAPAWDYVALGHYHVYRELKPNAFFSGSIDYTSVDTWGEKREEADGPKGKGFIEYDLVERTQTFHPLPPSRPLIELPSIDARNLVAADIDHRIRAIVDACVDGIDDKIVRLTVWDIPRHIARELDHKTIRDYKRRALSFQLDLRRPELNRVTSSGAPMRRPSLNEIVREKLAARVIDADVDRDTLIERAIAYLDEAQVAAVVSTPPAAIEA
ncbi:MAG TPA: DNA repair exonuclease [Gemmatimonadaceae bacterium]|jgi:DNA repair exonuclease SbcCD nuclease subunit|nr:DNA repair exonuclease [Gemmatimonadaceae bacterium]